MNNMVFNINKICRLCLTEEGTMIPIFDVSLHHSYSFKIRACVSIKMTMGDGLPTSICQQCADHVNDWFTFKQQCQHSDYTLHQYIEKNKIKDLNVQQTLGGRKFKPRCVINKKKQYMKANLHSISNLKGKLAGLCEAEGSSAEDIPEAEGTGTSVSDLANTSCTLNHISIDTDDLNVRNNPMGKHTSHTNSCSTVPSVKNEPLEEHYNHTLNIVTDGLEQSIKPQELDSVIFPSSNSCSEYEFETETKDDSICHVTITESDERVDLNIQDLRKPFTCSVCNKSFTRPSNFKKHLAKHNDGHLFKCQQCGEGFHSKVKHNAHLKTHAIEKPYLCNVCGKSFKIKDNFKKHLRVHSGDCPFLCNVCGKKFKRKLYLRDHLTMHSGERKYVCSICNKGFTWKVCLRAHSKVHMADRPLSCTVCNKTFKRKKALAGHVRIHTGEKPFVCTYCNRSFSFKWNLTQHLRLHTGTKPYVCPVCQEAFTHNVTLRNHVKQHEK